MAPSRPQWTVMVNMKTGCDGRPKVIPGLEALDGTRSFDMNMTWHEAIKSHFGVTVDPLRFSVMRLHRGKPPLPPKHNLMENIRVLMGEFQRIMPSYAIYVVENRLFSRKVNPSNVKISPSTAVSAPNGDNNDERRRSQAGNSGESNGGHTPGVSTINIPIRPRGGAKSVRVSKVRGKRESTHQNSIATRNDNGNVNVVQIKSSASVVDEDAATQSVNAVVKNRRLFSRKPGVTGPSPKSVRFVRKGASSPGLGPTTINCHSKNQEAGSVEGGPGPRYVLNNSDVELENGLPISRQEGQMDVDGDDDDIKSVGSQDSQDSQSADLEEMGIRNFDVQTPFLERARKNYTNSQLLMARHELETMKRHKSSRWTKWTLSAPTATNILRDLLGI